MRKSVEEIVFVKLLRRVRDILTLDDLYLQCENVPNQSLEPTLVKNILNVVVIELHGRELLQTHVSRNVVLDSTQSRKEAVKHLGVDDACAALERETLLDLAHDLLRRARQIHHLDHEGVIAGTQVIHVGKATS